ncbi:MAG TPA: glutathione S-transferase family protein [Candidatus Limnocylindrales bacterium]|nr:glutathione S-transferase family protein [Candidatus Limnocylindrales bacterium]
MTTSTTLYAIPFACSMAPHIALREAAVPHDVSWVARGSLAMADGRKYRDVNPKGKVSALRLPDGSIVTENIAVLLAIGDLAPDAGLSSPAGSERRLRLYEWLSFISTELHKQALWAHFDPDVPQAMKTHVAEYVLPKVLPHPEAALQHRRFLIGDDFSLADAYLFWTLVLLPQLGVSLEDYPALLAFRDSVKDRPSVAQTLDLERSGLLASSAFGSAGNTQ